jgi:hypothetical protein
MYLQQPYRVFMHKGIEIQSDQADVPYMRTHKNTCIRENIVALEAHEVILNKKASNHLTPNRYAIYSGNTEAMHVYTEREGPEARSSHIEMYIARVLTCTHSVYYSRYIHTHASTNIHVKGIYLSKCVYIGEAKNQSIATFTITICAFYHHIYMLH